MSLPPMYDSAQPISMTNYDPANGLPDALLKHREYQESRRPELVTRPSEPKKRRKRKPPIDWKLMRRHLDANEIDKIPQYIVDKYLHTFSRYEKDGGDLVGSLGYHAWPPTAAEARHNRKIRMLKRQNINYRIDNRLAIVVCKYKHAPCECKCFV